MNNYFRRQYCECPSGKLNILNQSVVPFFIRRTKKGLMAQVAVNHTSWGIKKFSYYKNYSCGTKNWYRDIKLPINSDKLNL